MSHDILITNNYNNINLQSLNINCKFRKDDIERARELEKEYKETLEELPLLPSETLAIAVKKELTQLTENKYYNFTQENNFIQYVLMMKEWLKDCNKAEKKESLLKDDSFFNKSHFKYNIIRS